MRMFDEGETVKLPSDPQNSFVFDEDVLLDPQNSFCLSKLVYMRKSLLPRGELSAIHI